MQEWELKKIIEALLFVSESPLAVKKIIEVCPDADNAAVRSCLKQLSEEYNRLERGISLHEVAGGFQFASNPDCADYLKKLYKTEKVYRLSAPALETLAIIAYKQPVTRAEIEFIRGVNVDGVVTTLEERQLIKTKGRKEVPGRPLLYGTGEEFLHYFGLKSLEDLPSLEEFTAQQLDKINEQPLSETEAAQDNSAENKEPDLPVPQEIADPENVTHEPEDISLEAEMPTADAEVKEEHDEYRETAPSN